jgi:hypothetical protein
VFGIVNHLYEEKRLFIVDATFYELPEIDGDVFLNVGVSSLDCSLSFAVVTSARGNNLNL